MEKIKKKTIAKWDKRWLILFALLLGSCVISFFFYRLSFWRVWMAIKDLGTSIAYYFGCLFANLFDFSGLDSIMPTVTVAPSVDFSTLLPIEWAAFKEKVAAFFPQVFDSENFRAWLSLVANYSEKLAQFLMLLSLGFGSLYVLSGICVGCNLY